MYCNLLMAWGTLRCQQITFTTHKNLEWTFQTNPLVSALSSACLCEGKQTLPKAIDGVSRRFIIILVIVNTEIAVKVWKVVQYPVSYFSHWISLPLEKGKKLRITKPSWSRDHTTIRRLFPGLSENRLWWFAEYSACIRLSVVCCLEPSYRPSLPSLLMF